MNCTCGGTTVVKDSRSIPEGVWRQRRCLLCAVTYTTLEQICETVSVTRCKKGGPVKVKVVKPVIPKVPRPKRPRKAKEPKPPKPPRPVKPKDFPPIVVPQEKTARARIEDMRMEKEYE